VRALAYGLLLESVSKRKMKIDVLRALGEVPDMTHHTPVFSSLKKILGGPITLLAGEILGAITHVATPDPVAALTFDDGPNPKFTPCLLDILEKHKARATFFMLGENAQRYPQLVQRVARAGHAIGNHSWNHPEFPSITGRERRAQIRRCAKAIAPHGQRLFRPPYGYQNIASCIDLLWLGYQVIYWNTVADDWCTDDAEWMAARLVNQVRPGSIVLLHDNICSASKSPYFDRGPLLKAVDMFLERLQGSFHFITIPELLRTGRPHQSLILQDH